MQKIALEDILNNATQNLATVHDTAEPNTFLQAGESRGGELEYGGILWGDYSEFVDMPNVKQIFGHTPNPQVRRLKTEISEHICIDTQGRHYAIYNDKNQKMLVRSV